MTIDDVYYFSHNRYMQPGNYKTAKNVEAKFQSFNGSERPSGEFYLHYFPSQHVRFRDGEDGLPTM